VGPEAPDIPADELLLALAGGGETGLTTPPVSAGGVTLALEGAALELLVRA